MELVSDLDTLKREGLGYKAEEAVIRIISSLVIAVEELQRTVEVVEKDMWRMRAEIATASLDEVINNSPGRIAVY